MCFGRGHPKPPLLIRQALTRRQNPPSSRLNGAGTLRIRNDKPAWRPGAAFWPRSAGNAPSRRSPAPSPPIAAFSRAAGSPPEPSAANPSGPAPPRPSRCPPHRTPLPASGKPALSPDPVQRRIAPTRQPRGLTPLPTGSLRRASTASTQSRPAPSRARPHRAGPPPPAGPAHRQATPRHSGRRAPPP